MHTSMCGRTLKAGCTIQGRPSSPCWKTPDFRESWSNLLLKGPNVVPSVYTTGILPLPLSLSPSLPAHFPTHMHRATESKDGNGVLLVYLCPCTWHSVTTSLTRSRTRTRTHTHNYTLRVLTNRPPTTNHRHPSIQPTNQLNCGGSREVCRGQRRGGEMAGGAAS